MKKLALLTTFLMMMLGVSLVNAQAYNGIGDKKVQAGLSPYGNGVGLTGTFDYGLHEVFSVGAGAEFYFDNDNDENFYIFGRADAHLGELIGMPSNMDLYPGVDLGVLGDGLGFGGHLGFRYFFQDNLGAYVELGSRGSIGIVLNL